MSKHGVNIDGLTAMHHELGREPRRDCPNGKRPAPRAAAKDGDKPLDDAQQPEFFDEERTS